MIVRSAMALVLIVMLMMLMMLMMMMMMVVVVPMALLALLMCPSRFNVVRGIQIVAERFGELFGDGILSYQIGSTWGRLLLLLLLSTVSFVTAIFNMHDSRQF